MGATRHVTAWETRAVHVEVPQVGVLGADLTVVRREGPVVVFAHGSGSSRHSPRNRAVARRLHDAGFGTLLLDLLTQEEDAREQRGGQLRFDVDVLADRLVGAVGWLTTQPDPHPGARGYFGASTGAAGALVAAARQGDQICAVVSRGGRPDLAGDLLPLVSAPTLLVVGERDPVVRDLNEQALMRLRCPRALEVVPGATHLFEEPGALERVADLAVAWFDRHLARAS
jgi:putative phosphoribosyl transferase